MATTEREADLDVHPFRHRVELGLAVATTGPGVAAPLGTLVSSKVSTSGLPIVAASARSCCSPPPSRRSRWPSS